jgi:hypothetical protein
VAGSVALRRPGERLAAHPQQSIFPHELMWHVVGNRRRPPPYHRQREAQQIRSVALSVKENSSNAGAVGISHNVHNLHTPTVTDNRYLRAVRGLFAGFHCADRAFIINPTTRTFFLGRDLKAPAAAAWDVALSPPPSR